MVEREFYKHVLKKVIDDTEKNKFESSHEVIQLLIEEIKERPNNEENSKPLMN